MISSAYAQAATATSDGGWVSFLPMILIFVVFWFLMIRPQNKRAKEHKAMLSALQKGDEVITQGGILGRITKISDDYLTIEIAEKIEVVVQKPAIGLVLQKGTLKTL